MRDLEWSDDGVLQLRAKESGEAMRVSFVPRPALAASAHTEVNWIRSRAVVYLLSSTAIYTHPCCPDIDVINMDDTRVILQPEEGSQVPPEGKTVYRAERGPIPLVKGATRQHRFYEQIPVSQRVVITKKGAESTHTYHRPDRGISLLC